MVVADLVAANHSEAEPVKKDKYFCLFASYGWKFHGALLKSRGQEQKVYLKLSWCIISLPPLMYIRDRGRRI